MTIDEAIQHAEEVAKGYEEDISKWEYTLSEYRKRECVEQTTIPRCEKALNRCKKCASEHRQLAEWLKDYKRLLEKKYALDETQEQLDFVQPHKKIPVTLTISGYDKLIDLANAIENDDSDYWTNKKISSALRNISSIKPQPYEDAINRQAVLDMLEDINAETEGVGFYYEHYVDYIKALPPVKPKEPKIELQKGVNK